MTQMTQEILKLSFELFKATAPLLRGKPPEMQSAALADLVSIWLVGHNLFDGNGDRSKSIIETQKLRETLLVDFVDLVRDLIPHSAKQLGVIVTHHDRD